MRYLELSEDNSETEIKRILAKCFVLKGADAGVKIQHGQVDITGDCELMKNLPQIPLKFRKVTGTFVCYAVGLTSLTNAPIEVGSYMDCRENELTSLVGGPKKVKGSFYCSSNQLTSLIGAPELVGINLECEQNNLTSLEGFPIELKSSFHCSWHEDLPLLRSLQAKQGVRVFLRNTLTPHPITRIINKYLGHTNLRHAILDCQRDMIAAGYEGNAQW